MPDTLTITREWFELLEGLPTAENRKNVFYAVSEYAFKGREPEGLTAMEKSVFMNMRYRIQKRNRDTRFYTNRKTKTSESDAGISSPKRRNPTPESDAESLSSNQHRNTDISLSLSSKDDYGFPTPESDAPKKNFKVPSLEEVKSYVKEKNLPIDPEEFYSFYSANGWHVGKNKMKSWEMAAQYWSRRRRNDRSPPKRDYSGI